MQLPASTCSREGTNAVGFKELATLIHEIGSLKTLPRSGWNRVGVKARESIAEHMYRSMLLGYTLGELEGEDGRKIALMIMFHDLHEARLGDSDFNRRHYVNQKDAEMQVAVDQSHRMPAKMAANYLALFKEFEARKTRSSIIAKDADWLECAVQAIEYRSKASGAVEEWITNVTAALKTDSANKLIARMRDGSSLSWWQDFNDNELALFLHEVGSLKTLNRSGWNAVGVVGGESVAAHMYRAMLIGYLLAELEGADAQKVALMLMFHDLHESRLGDADTVGRHYVNQDEQESQVAIEQSQRMPPKMAKEYLLLFTEFNARKTKESIVAKDADYLECAFQAIEYRGKASEPVDDWIQTARNGIKTESARKLLLAAQDGKLQAWWAGFEERKKK